MKKLFLLLLVAFTLSLACVSTSQAQISAPVNVTIAPPVPATWEPVQPLPVPPAVMPVQSQLVEPIKNPDASQEANIYLNFENASLASVVNHLGEQKKINIIPDKNLDSAKVTLTTRSALTQDRAWNIMLTLLEMNGFSLIKVGNLYRVVPSANNGQEPLPIYSSATGTPPEDLPDSDMIVRYVYFFTNIKTTTAKSIFGKMLDNADKNVIENPDLNACIIKDSCLNIKAAMRILKELDSGGLREAIEVIPLTWANGDNVANLFAEMLGTADKDQRIISFTPSKKESTYFSAGTKIIYEPTKNALILLGTQKHIDKIKNFIYKYIDVPIDSAESRLHVRELRYVRAQDIQPILQSVVTRPKDTGDKSLIIEGGYKAFEDVIISAETSDDTGNTTTKRGGGNRLIMACNKEDRRRLDDFIDKLDKPQPQVAIEVMIVDVNLEDDKTLGAQLFGIKGKPLGQGINIDFENIGAAGQKPLPTGGLTPPAFFNQDYLPLANTAATAANNSSFVTLGTPGVPGPNGTTLSNNNIWGLITAQASLSNSQVVDQPYVVANNHQPSEVTVKISARLAGPLDQSKSINPVQRQEPVDATITTKLTPHINLIGIVDLEIDITVEQFDASLTQLAGDNTVSKNTRHLITKASMGTGEILTLGGLTVSQINENVYKTPILSEIPFFGSFFKYKNKVKTATNLYIFIRPSIIKPRFEGAPDEYTQLKLDYAKYQIMKNDTYVNDTDPIQRWFFKPTHQTIKQRISDASKGILRPVDDYTYGKDRPQSVDIQEDPFYTASEDRAKVIARQKAEKLKHHQG